jgi:hypothetical protein
VAAGKQVAGAEATAMGPKLRAKGEPPPCYGKFWDDKSLQFLCPN